MSYHVAMSQNPGTPGEHQNIWDLWMFIPLKMVLIGINPYPYHVMSKFTTPNCSHSMHKNGDLIQRRTPPRTGTISPISDTMPVGIICETPSSSGV